MIEIAIGINYKLKKIAGLVAATISVNNNFSFEMYKLVNEYHETWNNVSL